MLHEVSHVDSHTGATSPQRTPTHPLTAIGASTPGAQSIHYRLPQPSPRTLPDNLWMKSRNRTLCGPPILASGASILITAGGRHDQLPCGKPRTVSSPTEADYLELSTR